jgi:predicted nucleic acid-binding protein
MTGPAPRIRLVVDASVAVKWLIPEPYTEEASRLRAREYEILAPGHVRVEVANALWKRHRRGDLTREQARDGVGIISADGAIGEPQELGSLLPASFEIAIAHGRTVYDALYVALSLREDCPFVTADRPLYESLSATYRDTMLWVEDIPDLREPGA